MASEFPARAVFQGGGFLKEVQQELEARSVPVVLLTTPTDASDWQDRLRAELRQLGLGRRDLVVALPSWVDVALQHLGILVPQPPDYPGCLQHLLRRRVWSSTLGRVQSLLASGEASQLFIKPAVGAKGFSGTVVTGAVDDMLDMLLDPSIFPSLGPDVEVHCSEVIEMNSEYAVYVVDGAIRAICHYMCKQSTCRCKDGDRAAGGEQIVELDMSVVEEAVRLLAKSENYCSLTGYRADFALISRDGGLTFETALVEVNDGYVAGRYDGMSAADFTDMVVSRFSSLQCTA